MDPGSVQRIDRQALKEIVLGSTVVGPAVDPALGKLIRSRSPSMAPLPWFLYQIYPTTSGLFPQP
jgi:hypothetical protein